MRDDIVRKAGQNDLAREIRTRVLIRGLEVPKEQRALFAAIECVGLVERVRKNTESRTMPAVLRANIAKTPSPPQRAVKTFECLARNRIDHLLMKLRV